MSELRETAEALTTARYRSPKTVLGFFAIVLGIVMSGVAVVIGIFARIPDLRYLIVPVLVFAAAIILALMIGVFLTAWKDPTILMLGQVSGEVFVANRRLTLGDSIAGESSVGVFGDSLRAITSSNLPPQSTGDQP